MNLRSTTDTLGEGTRIAEPSILAAPDRHGMKGQRRVQITHSDHPDALHLARELFLAGIGNYIP